MPDLESFFTFSFWIVIGNVLLSALFIWLAIIGGRNYTVKDTEAHSEEYGEVIMEGHGGMTAFLWVSFIAMFIWTIYYFVVNWDQFYVIFA